MYRRGSEMCAKNYDEAGQILQQSDDGTNCHVAGLSRQNWDGWQVCHIIRTKYCAGVNKIVCTGILYYMTGRYCKIPVN